MNSKILKKIVVAVIMIVLIIAGIANIRITSVSEHQSEQQSLYEEILGTAAAIIESSEATQQASESSSQVFATTATQGATSTVTQSTTQENTQPTQSATQGSTQPTQPATQGNTQPASNQEKITCTVAIDCSTLSDNLSALINSELAQYVPDNGIILADTTIELPQGATAYDALSSVCKALGIQLEAKFTAIYNTYYVEGIGYLYEKNAGNMSGWIYKVNGRTANVGASAYKLKSGDKITWHYTIDGGKDVS